MKTAIIEELTELNKLNVVSKSLINRVKNGDFDATIIECSNMSVSELSDLIAELN